MARKKFIKFQLSRGVELFFVVLMLASLMALFQETSLFRTVGASWSPHLLGGVTFSGIAAFWVTIILFHISLFVILGKTISDAITKRRVHTSQALDFVAGFLAIIGIYLVLMSTIYFLYKGQNSIQFLWGVSSITLLQIGFLIEGVVTLFFSTTT